MSTPYRTAAVVSSAPRPKPVGRRSPAPLRALLVIGAWSPAHVLLAAACSRAFGLDDTLFLVLEVLCALACVLYASVLRGYHETYAPTALFTSASACRVGWALVLLTPVVGVAVYLAWLLAGARVQALSCHNR